MQSHTYPVKIGVHPHTPQHWQADKFYHARNSATARGSDIDISSEGVLQSRASDLIFVGLPISIKASVMLEAQSHTGDTTFFVFKLPSLRVIQFNCYTDLMDVQNLVVSHPDAFSRGCAATF
jgi:hypothetical protein